VWVVSQSPTDGNESKSMVIRQVLSRYSTIILLSKQ
jgi:hypothetical protein